MRDFWSILLYYDLFYFLKDTLQIHHPDYGQYRPLKNDSLLFTHGRTSVHNLTVVYIKRKNNKYFSRTRKSAVTEKPSSTLIHAYNLL